MLYTQNIKQLFIEYLLAIELSVEKLFGLIIPINFPFELLAVKLDVYDLLKVGPTRSQNLFLFYVLARVIFLGFAVFVQLVKVDYWLEDIEPSFIPLRPIPKILK